MPRYVRGVTLSPQERALLGPANGGKSTVVSSHRCTVTLPDDRLCEVSYQRINPRSHKFDFLAPVHQRLWVDPHLDGTVAAIEHEAQSITSWAFQLAQEAEQKEMKRKTASSTERSVCIPHEERLPTKVAVACAGKYAVCLKFGSGNLLRIGAPYSSPEDAILEVEQGKHQTVVLQPSQEIVLGICNRPARQWQEPRFLVKRLSIKPTDGDPAPIKEPPKRKTSNHRRRSSTAKRASQPAT